MERAAMSDIEQESYGIDSTRTKVLAEVASCAAGNHYGCLWAPQKLQTKLSLVGFT